MYCFLAVTVPSRAASAREWPLWDGHESTASYAARVNLSPTKSIDLGGGVTLDLVLIPAGKFVMGMSKPLEPAVTVLDSQILLAIGVALTLAFASMPVVRKLQRKKAAFSLRWLLLFTAALGLSAGGGARWRLAVQELARYEAEKIVYEHNRPNETRAHPVTLTQPFYMGKYTVTQAQYEAVVGGNPSHFKGAQLPVESVTWDEATAYCKKLAERLWDKTLEAHLPTEAQWEYACRAGTTTAYYSGNQESDLDAVAWYNANSIATHLVGAKKANAFGLYDMHGNVWQWCQDAYTRDYEKLGAIDPLNVNAQGAVRLVRGGSWSNPAEHNRSSSRGRTDFETRGKYNGFRVVLSVSSLSRTPP